jgi:hypothetical protein
MKKAFLIYPVIFSFFMFIFSSCIHRDFNFDDEKLDKNITFSDSINLPIGSIQRISIYEELKKVYDPIKVGDDNVLCIGYEGTFPIKFPKYEIPTVEKLESTIPIIGFSGKITIPPVTDRVTLIGGAKTKYEVERSKLIDDDDLTIIPEKVEFTSFAINMGFELSGIIFESVGEDAQLIVSLTFPDDYNVKDNPGNTIIESVNIKKDIQDKGNFYCPLGIVEINSYTFNDITDELTYNVTLAIGNSPIVFTATDPVFKLILEAENQNIAVSYLECSIDGIKTFKGTEGGFGDLQNAFGETNILEFKDPSVSVNLTTNLESQFEWDIEMSKDNLTAYLQKPFLFDEGSTRKTFVLTPENFINFDKIISTPFPDELDYKVELTFNNQKAKLLSPDQIVITSDYLFNIPLNFNRIDLSVKDTITDLFGKDIYDQIFSYAQKDISIEADLVDVSIGDGKINVDISAAILDADFKEIIHLGSILREDKTPNLSIIIGANDLEKMKKARHLKFDFRLSGEGAITESDYISISGVRLISGSGIHHEL